MNSIEQRLSGGHPNSLGNTEEVVAEVLANPALFEELFSCYFSDDEVVRLRVSSSVKRVAKANLGLVAPYTDRLLKEITRINQPSTQWTLAELFDLLKDEMTEEQRTLALSNMKANLEHHNDWIVLNNCMQILAKWTATTPGLREWLKPHLQRLAKDERKSVSKRATKLLATLN